MHGLRILITNNTLAGRCGSELYVRDVAIALLRLGHRPVTYSRTLGPVADDLRLATVPVVDDLSHVGEPPDIIHGHHNLETMTALAHFPATPAVFVCHGSLPWEEAPPPAPRIVRYVAVDEACRDRLVFQHGIRPDRIELVLNFVDLERFRPRSPLPDRPQRAIVFSNHATDGTSLPAIRAACEAESIEVDVAGAGSGRVLDRPEDVLGNYDLVFARARAALEAMAIGTAVIACDFAGLGGFVTPERFDEWRKINFGLRCLRRPLDRHEIRQEIRAYDPSAAAVVSRRVRCEAGLDDAIPRIVRIYLQVLEEWRARPAVDPVADSAAMAAYLRQLEPRVKGNDRTLRTLLDELATERQAHASRLTELAIERQAHASTLTELTSVLEALEGERSIRAALQNKRGEAERDRTALRAEIDEIRQLRTYRLRGWLLRWPKLVSLYQSLSGRYPARPA
jgi:Glycosyltransferase Family 4